MSSKVWLDINYLFSNLNDQIPHITITKTAIRNYDEFGKKYVQSTVYIPSSL